MIREIVRCYHNGSSITIVLPRVVRQELSINAGDHLVMSVIGDCVVLQTLENELRIKGAAAARCAIDAGVEVAR